MNANEFYMHDLTFQNSGLGIHEKQREADEVWSPREIFYFTWNAELHRTSGVTGAELPRTEHAEIGQIRIDKEDENLAEFLQSAWETSWLGKSGLCTTRNQNSFLAQSVSDAPKDRGGRS